MKFVSISAVAFAAALIIPGIAQAQSFDGPSIGVQAGWSQTKTDAPETELGVLPLDSSKDAATIGGFVGYDKSFGKFVVGGEAGFSASTSDELTGSSAAGTITIDPRWSFDLSARAGYLINPKTLAYVRGGYANERIRTSVTGTGATALVDENRDGWMVGGGIERQILPHVSARIEYRYSDFDEGEGTFDRHQTLLGLSYRF